MLTITTPFAKLRSAALGLCFALALVCLQTHASFAQGALPAKWLYSPINLVTSVAYSPDGSHLAIGGTAFNADPGVQIYTVATGAVISLPTAANDAINSVAFSPDGQTLAIGGLRRQYANGFSSVTYFGVLELWNISTGHRIATLDTAANNSGISQLSIGGINGAGLPVTGGVHSVAFSPDGKTLAVGGYSGTNTHPGSIIELWSVAHRTRTVALNTVANAVISTVVFSPDSKTLADGGLSFNGSTGIYSGVLEVWNLVSGTRTEMTSTAANGGILSVVFSPDGKTLADGGQSYNSSNAATGGVLEVWNVATGALQKSLPTAAVSSVNSVTFSPDGSALADGGSSTTTGQTSGTASVASSVVELWNVSTGNRTTTLNGPSVVNSVAFSPDGSTLADGGQMDTHSYGLVQLWNVATGVLAKTISTSEISLIQALALSPDGKTVAIGVEGVDSSGNDFFHVELRSASTGAVMLSLPTAANDFIQSLAFSPDGTMLAIGGEEESDGSNGLTFAGVLELWNVSTGKLIARLPTAATVIVNSVAFSPDGKTLADGGATLPEPIANAGVFELWNVATQTVITSQVRSGNDGDSGYSSVAFSPDGKTLVTGGRIETGSLLELRDASTGKLTASFRSATDAAVYTAAFSPDGKTLAVGGSILGSLVPALEFWDVATGIQRASLTPVPGTHKIYSLAFSHTGQDLFVGTDTNLEIFNTSTGNLLNYYFQNQRFAGPASVAISSDGRLLAYGAFFGALGITPTPYANTFLDFNGDGFSDLLFQNSATGAIAAGYMDGASQISSAPFSLNPGPEYALVGVGDFIGDGTTTLVLQDRTDDTIVFWYPGGVNNTTIAGGDYVMPNPLPGWKVVGVGDFNGDGKSDLVFQNQTTHQIVFWFMDGPNYQGGASLLYYPQAGWQVVGAGDFNGDGYADLIFQNQTTGQIALWFMRGVTYLGGTTLASIPQPGWKVVGVADYNGDGSPDLLFQNTTTNRAAIWYLQTATFQGAPLEGSANLLLPANSGQIVGPR